MTSSVEITKCIRDALSAIAAPRFFRTERGFQGELLVQLSRRLPLADPEIIEQEYQKRMRDHGLTVRPDIIIHEPFDSARHGARSEGNHAVVELKLNATAAQAAEEFGNLASMIRMLGYPLGVFVNIASSHTYVDLVPKAARGHVVAFAVTLKGGNVHVIEART
jgi:hypothetical protein